MGKIVDYFVLANASFEIFKEFIKRWSNDEKHADFKPSTAIFSMYTNGKICLDLTKNINQKINDEDLKKMRLQNQSWAKHFNDFRNDASSHPINKRANYFSFVPGWEKFALFLRSKKTMEKSSMLILEETFIKIFDLTQTHPPPQLPLLPPNPPTPRAHTGLVL